MYSLKFNTNDDIYYRLMIKQNNIILILEIYDKVLYNEIEYFKYENSINYIINNNIAIYYKIIHSIYYDEKYHDYRHSTIYFKNINPEIILKLI